MFITDLNLLPKYMTPQSEDFEDRAIKVATAIELLEHCNFLEWPFYFRRLLLCANCNQYRYRIKIVTFFELNKYSLISLCEFLYHLNPHSLNQRSISKILALKNYFYRIRNSSRYSSYDVKRKIVTNFRQRIIVNAKHGNFGYISCDNTNHHLRKYGIRDLLPYEDPAGYKYL